MLGNGDAESTFHAEGTACAKGQMWKRARCSQPCSGAPASRDSFKIGPHYTPSNQNVPPRSLLNGNSGYPIGCRIEHCMEMVKTSLDSYLETNLSRPEIAG